MGLGKTIQVIALLLLRTGAARPQRRAAACWSCRRRCSRNWQAELARFAPSLRVARRAPVGDARPRARGAARRRGSTDVDVVITTLRHARRACRGWRRRRGTLVVARRGAGHQEPRRQADARGEGAARRGRRIALTGTPVENRLGDLWSLFDFLDPGPARHRPSAFDAVRQARWRARRDEPLRAAARAGAPYILRRLKTDRRVIADLPDKTEVKACCGLRRAAGRALPADASTSCAASCARAPTGIKRRGMVLAYLMRLQADLQPPVALARRRRLRPRRTAASSPACASSPRRSPARQEKALVFTQFREIDRAARGVPGGGLRPARAGPSRRRRRCKQRQELVRALPGATSGVAVLRPLAQGGRHRPQPDRRVARHPLRPLVEPRRREPGHRPRLPHRPEAQRAGPQVRLPRDGRGADRRADRVEARPGARARRRRRRGALLTELGDDELLRLVSLDLARASAEQ